MATRYPGVLAKDLQGEDRNAVLGHMGRARLLVGRALRDLKFANKRQVHLRERQADGSTIHAMATNFGFGAPIHKVWIDVPPVSEEKEALPQKAYKGYPLFYGSIVTFNGLGDAYGGDCYGDDNGAAPGGSPRIVDLQSSKWGGTPPPSDFGVSDTPTNSWVFNDWRGARPDEVLFWAWRQDVGTGYVDPRYAGRDIEFDTVGRELYGVGGILVHTISSGFIVGACRQPNSGETLGNVVIAIWESNAVSIYELSDGTLGPIAGLQGITGDIENEAFYAFPVNFSSSGRKAVMQQYVRTAYLETTRVLITLDGDSGGFTTEVLPCFGGVAAGSEGGDIYGCSGSVDCPPVDIAAEYDENDELVELKVGYKQTSVGTLTLAGGFDEGGTSTLDLSGSTTAYLYVSGVQVMEVPMTEFAGSETNTVVWNVVAPPEVSTRDTNNTGINLDQFGYCLRDKFVYTVTSNISMAFSGSCTRGSTNTDDPNRCEYPTDVSMSGTKFTGYTAGEPEISALITTPPAMTYEIVIDIGSNVPIQPCSGAPAGELTGHTGRVYISHAYIKSNYTGRCIRQMKRTNEGHFILSGIVSSGVSGFATSPYTAISYGLLFDANAGVISGLDTVFSGATSSQTKFVGNLAAIAASQETVPVTIGAPT